MPAQDWSRDTLEAMSEPEFFIRWWITFKGPPAAMLDRRTMVSLLLAERDRQRPGEAEPADLANLAETAQRRAS